MPKTNNDKRILEEFMEDFFQLGVPVYSGEDDIPYDIEPLTDHMPDWVDDDGISILFENWLKNKIKDIIQQAREEERKEIVEILNNELKKLTTYYDGLKSTAEKSANIAVRQSFSEIINLIQDK